MAGARLVDLMAAYDAAWHRGLLCKLLRLLKDKYMVYIIMELFHNRIFALATNDSEQRRLRRIKNGNTKRSVLARLKFTISVHKLPALTSTKYAYADDFELMHSAENHQKGF